MLSPAVLPTATVNSTGDVDLLRFTEPHAEPVDIGQERITGTLCDIAWVGDGNAVIVVGECGAHVLGLNGELLFSQTICDLESVAVVDENCVLVTGNDERSIRVKITQASGQAPPSSSKNGILILFARCTSIYHFLGHRDKFRVVRG
jgi:hypothetical protein